MGTEKMSLPKKLGRPKKIESPERMWELFADYIAYTDANKWESGELIKSGELAGVTVRVMKREPYTWSGFQVYLLMQGTITVLDEYKSNRKGGYEEFSSIIKMIDQVMYRNKFIGATVGDFNANIIARDLGLAEKSVTEVKDTTEEIDYDSLSDSALEEIIKAKRKPDGH